MTEQNRSTDGFSKLKRSVVYFFIPWRKQFAAWNAVSENAALSAVLIKFEIKMRSVVYFVRERNFVLVRDSMKPRDTFSLSLNYKYLHFVNNPDYTGNLRY